jgi:hypothetical protein
MPALSGLHLIAASELPKRLDSLFGQPVLPEDILMPLPASALASEPPQHAQREGVLVL